MSPAAVRWSRIVDRSYHTSMPLREFARREGVNPNTLAWWRWRLRRETTEQGFAEVVVVDDEREEARCGGGLVVHVGAARVEVDGSSDLQLLRAVVEVLS